MNTHSALQPPSLRTDDQRVHWGNLHGSSASLAVASLAVQAREKIILVVAPDIHTARRLELDLRFFTAQQELPCHYFPDWETLPYDHFSPHPDLVSERLLVLHHLLRMKHGIVIAALPTLMYRLMPRDYLQAHAMALSCGEVLDFHNFRQALLEAGYHAVNQVFEHGEFAIRGAIMDIFPMGNPFPYRLELFDEKIETIRRFDPETQCSVEKIEKIRLISRAGISADRSRH